MVTPEEIRSIEPHAAGLAGIHVACTGITDYRGVAQALARRLEQRGAMLALGSPLTDVQDKGTTLRLTCGSRQFQVGFLMNCAGLQSDRVARLAGLNPAQKIVPFRGEYFVLRPERRHLVRHLIYPVPDPAFPFLGVHFTRMVDGSIHAGPNAVLAFGREGYSKLSLNPRDLLETLSYPGFWRMALRHWPMAIQEYRRSLSRRLFAASLARLVPGVTPDDLVPCEAGIRAQAMDTRGNMVDDFLIVHGHRSFHVLNAPSPAATASLAIAREVVRQAQSHLSA
jgi:L-2-hydroxyglutarate oxidase